MDVSPPQPVLICGLGRLGQHCAVLLKELGIPVFGMDAVERNTWELEGLPQLFGRYTVGDGRRHSALERAGLFSCRAILLITGDERVNVSAALAARSLHPGIRLVIRSSKSNLNSLLSERLGNLVAFDIAELPANAFTLAAIGDETVGLFAVEGQLLRVVANRVTASHRWHQSRRLYDLNNRRRRVLHRTSLDQPQPIDFHGWDPNGTVQAGDLVVCIEYHQPAPASPPTASLKRTWHLPAFTWTSLVHRITQRWSGASQTFRVSALVTGTLLVLHVTGVIVYKLRYPEVSLLDAFNVATVLIFDGYSNMFAQLKLPFPIPLWLLLFSLLLTMSGAVVMGMLYAYLTARVLSARLHFRRRPGRIPREHHTIVIGLGPLGMRITELLHQLDHAVVGISEHELESGLLPRIPVITGDPQQCLSKVNCARARSVVVATDDDVSNLELALMAARANPDCNVVIRTDDAAFGRNLRSLAPHTRAMSAYALSAEAFVAGALGENVLSLIRIGNETVLATEYRVEGGDTLAGRLIGEVTSGYGLVAILYQKNPTYEAEFFPSDDIRLEAGSRLVVLATMDGLQNVEHGRFAERTCHIRILQALSEEAAFEGARTIARVTGCDLDRARTLMVQLPANFPQPLFHHQAERLVRELMVARVDAEVVTARFTEPRATAGG